MEHTAQLLIIRGLPGSGKSTYAETLKDRVHFETDMYFSLTGEYKFNGSKLPQAHKWCQEAVKASLEAGNKVVVSNTFTRLWEIKPYLDIAADLGVSVEVYEMPTLFKNIHNVPEETIERMKARWEPWEENF